jgi:arylsulfatase A-like enzyme
VTSRPDIVLLVLDTQRADRLSCYGYPRNTTPHLDSFAAEATLFRRSFAAAQWTIPSHSSLFTGLYPASHGAQQTTAQLPAELPTLAERLARHGYHTAAFCNNPLVGVVNNGLRRGFHSFLNYSGLLTSRPNQAGARPGPIGRYRQWFKGRLAAVLHDIQDSFARSEALLEFAFTPLMVPLWQTALSFKGNSRKSLGDAARLLVERRGIAAGQPAFCFINLMGVHAPFHPSRQALERFAPEVLRDREAQRYVQRFNGDVFGWLAPFAADDRHGDLLSNVYDAEVYGQDELVGQFLHQLRQSGVLDRTLVIICSDHGEHLGEKGLVGHTVSAYNELVRVPLLVRDPAGDFGRGALSDQVVSLRRVFHTALTAAGAAEEGERAYSLAQSDHADPDRGTAFVEATPLQNVLGIMLKRHPELVRARQFDQVRRAVVHGGYKLIRTGATLELYDLDTDIDETIDLHELLPERVEALEQLLDDHEPEPDGLASAALPDTDDPLVQRRLRELGYLE